MITMSVIEYCDLLFGSSQFFVWVNAHDCGIIEIDTEWPTQSKYILENEKNIPYPTNGLPISECWNGDKRLWLKEEWEKNLARKDELAAAEKKKKILEMLQQHLAQ